MKLWIVGKIVDIQNDRTPWQFVGVYTTEKRAIKKCTSYHHFMAPFKLDRKNNIRWSKTVYPLMERNTNDIIRNKL